METCSSRVLLLCVPTCAVLTLVRRLRGGCPPHLVDSRLRGNDVGLGPLRLGMSVWLAVVGGVRNTLRVRALQRQRSIVTGWWQRCAHLHSSERKTSFSGLWRNTAGGSCVGDPVLCRPLPYFIIQLSISYV